MSKRKLILFIALISFALNLVWENTQAVLYKGYNNFWGHFPTCLWGTVGDVAITLLLFAAFAGLYRNWEWVTILNWKTVVPLAVAGFAIGVVIEFLALVVGRWAYAESMPLLPKVGVGLWPVLQMTILPGLTFFISAKAVKQ